MGKVRALGHRRVMDLKCTTYLFTLKNVARKELAQRALAQQLTHNELELVNVSKYQFVIHIT